MDCDEPVGYVPTIRAIEYCRVGAGCLANDQEAMRAISLLRSRGYSFDQVVAAFNLLDLSREVG